MLKFNDFVSESLLGLTSIFTFVPVDKNFKSLDSNLTKSKTPLPSEITIPGIKGFLLVPTTIETSKMILSPYFKAKSPTVDGTISYTRDSKKDGIIAMNGGDEFTTGSKTGVASISANVPGFGQQPALYFKSGSAFILEILMKKNDWEERTVGDIRGKRISNGFPDNKCVEVTCWETIEVAGSMLREIFAAASSDCGLIINWEKIEDPEKYDATEELIALFKTRPGDFMAMDFSQEIFDKISNIVKEEGGPEMEDLSKTIDNLSDLKASGLFDD